VNPEPVNVAGWRTLDEGGRRLIIEHLRPHLRAVAAGLGAQTRSERREVLEALGLASLAEAGWGIIALGDGAHADPTRYL